MPLPDTPLTIHGGCNCRAIRYEINIPALSVRPLHPFSHASVHIPFIAICHCNDCRRATGALTMAAICNPTEFVRISLLPRSSPLPPLGKTRVEPPNDDAEREWIPAQEVFQPSDVLKAPLDSFIASYKPSEGVTRTFCARCGTNVTYSRYPMPEGWPEMLDILMGTIDREDLENGQLRPERHVWWDKGIDWVKKLFSEGDEGMPKHPLARLTDTV
ncbi:hypothetical protein MMC08_003783 [Hypocenomyce scalaris]|nr:hypothetical protein [Hypocenomyce scalaris]